MKKKIYCFLLVMIKNNVYGMEQNQIDNALIINNVTSEFRTISNFLTLLINNGLIIVEKLHNRDKYEERRNNFFSLIKTIENYHLHSFDNLSINHPIIKNFFSFLLTIARHEYDKFLLNNTLFKNQFDLFQSTSNILQNIIENKKEVYLNILNNIMNNRKKFKKQTSVSVLSLLPHFNLLRNCKKKPHIAIDKEMVENYIKTALHIQKVQNTKKEHHVFSLNTINRELTFLNELRFNNNELTSLNNYFRGALGGRFNVLKEKVVLIDLTIEIVDSLVKKFINESHIYQNKSNDN